MADDFDLDRLRCESLADVLDVAQHEVVGVRAGHIDLDHNVVALRRDGGPEPYLTRRQLAAFMQVSERTVDRWTREGMPHETFGLRTKRFRASEAVGWARTRTRRSA